MLQSIVGKRWQTSAHTLSVKKRIDDKRENAMKAGGEKRIANQHKKVNMTDWLDTCQAETVLNFDAVLMLDSMAYGAVLMVRLMRIIVHGLNLRKSKFVGS